MWIIDKEIHEKLGIIEKKSKNNLEIAKTIAEEHVLGYYKEFLENKMKSLELHITNLKKKRKYSSCFAIEDRIIKEEIYSGVYNKESITALHEIHVEMEMEVHKIAKQKDEVK